MKIILIIIFYHIFILTALCQERAITYLDSEGILPNSLELKNNKIKRIESRDYYIGESEVMTIWTFNSDGLPLSIEYKDSISNFKNFNYDINNRITRYSYIGWNENYAKFDTNTTTYFYLTSGKLEYTTWKSYIREEVDSFYYENGKITHKTTTRNYTYDDCTKTDTLFYNEFGLPLKFVSSDSPQTTIKYTYDKDNKLINKVRIKHCVGSPYKEEITFYYDSKEKLVLELITHITLKDNFINNIGYKYYYNRKGFLKRIDHLQSSEYKIHSTFKYYRNQSR